MTKNLLSRRRFLALSATISASALAACVAPSAPAPASAPAEGQASAPAIEPKTVSHWVYSTLPMDRDTHKSVPADQTTNVVNYFDWNLEKFNEAEPNVEVQLEYLPHDQSWFAKIDSSLIAGTPPDVVQGPVSEAAKYIPLGALSPIEGYMSPEIKTDLHPAIIAEATFDGHQYIWPWRLSFGGGIALNATEWEQNGVGDMLPSGATRRWLMDDFLEAAKANTTGESYGTVLSTDIHYQITQFMFGFGARLFNEDETEVILNSPEGVEGLQWLIDLEKVHKAAVPGSAIRKAQEAGQIFTEGKAASFPSQGSGKTPPEFVGREDFNWYWTPPPNVPGQEPAVMTNIHGHYVFQQKDTDRTAAAQNWTQFLTRPDALKLSLDSFGMPPALQSLWGAIEDENMKVGLTFADMMVTFGRRASAAPITFSLAPRMLEAALSGQLTAQQALDEFAAESNKLIAEAIAG
ncbi:MAG: extracellular solute-binding protein [Caldilineaceae bacterium]